METFLTIFSGTMVFVIGQIIVKLVIDPIQQFKAVIADISHALIEYAHIYSNPGLTGTEREAEVSGKFRQLSSRRNAAAYLIPFYSSISKWILLPSRDNVDKATGHLIALSNGFTPTFPNILLLNMFRAQHICDELGIYVSTKERLSKEWEVDMIASWRQQPGDPKQNT